MPDKPRYNKTEIGALIQRATELQKKDADAGDNALELQEVEHIAAELGIAPEYVRDAARELAHGRPATPDRSLTGAPFKVGHHRVVPGSMTDDRWELVVTELRRMTGAKGTIDSIGRTREWSRTVEDMGTTLYGTMVSARSDDDRTSLSFKKHYGGLAVTAYFISMFVVLFAVGITLDEASNFGALYNLMIIAVSGLGIMAAVRAGIGMWSRKQERQLMSMADRIENVLSRSGTVSPATSDRIESGSPTSEERLELPDDDEVDGASVARRDRTRG